MRTWIAFALALAAFLSTASGQSRTVPYRSQTRSVKIINGDVARKGQFPYQAGIYIDYSGFCGGSLIHVRWILTAGHCVDGSSVFFVYLGADNMMAPKEADRKVHVTRQSYPRPDYDFPYVDIALLKLNRDVTLSNYIKVIPLPTSTDATYVGHKAIISGWGRTSDADSHTSTNMRYVSLNVVNITVCQQEYGDTSLGASLICTHGDDNKGTCQGDSGGPLVIPDSGDGYLLIGATSFGSNAGCESGASNGFASVAHFLPWIASTTGLPFI